MTRDEFHRRYSGARRTKRGQYALHGSRRIYINDEGACLVTDCGRRIETDAYRLAFMAHCRQTGLKDAALEIRAIIRRARIPAQRAA